MKVYDRIVLFIMILTISLAFAQEESSFILDRNLSPAPWSHLDARAPEGQFRFAILADRTGGMRPGIFEKAVDRVNLLQPEFVLCIGDQIDGYTEDQTLMDEQWQEFNAIIAGLEMPFFYLPGNHDISNEIMAGDWKKRFNVSYYHFVYKDVLFLFLNTEDGGGSTISPEQVQYFSKVLKNNPHPRWIFVLMHKPLWDYGNKGGFEHIEQLLEGKNYTLFSGHTHNYLYKEKNGNKHFILATTGGGSELRGPEFGEFDHITWVTMNPDGPRIALIGLDGIHDENIVTEHTFPMVETLRTGRWLSVQPLVHESPSFGELDITVMLKNTTQQTLRVTGELHPTRDVTFTPDVVEMTVGPESVKELPLKMTANGGLKDIAFLDPVSVRLAGEFTIEGQSPLSLPAEKELLMDWLHTVPPVSIPPLVDGDLGEWAPIPFIEVKRPQFLEEGWDWKGPDDSWFRFAVVAGGKEIFLAIELFDDRLFFLDSPPEQAVQDKVFIHLYYGPQSKESSFSLVEDSLIDLVCAPVSGSRTVRIYHNRGTAVNVSARGAVEQNIMRLEMCLPVTVTAGETFRLNVGFMDQDNPQNTKPSIIWWRPLWDSRENYPMSGTFIREP